MNMYIYTYTHTFTFMYVFIAKLVSVIGYMGLVRGKIGTNAIGIGVLMKSHIHS